MDKLSFMMTQMFHQIFKIKFSSIIQPGCCWCTPDIRTPSILPGNQPHSIWSPNSTDLHFGFLFVYTVTSPHIYFLQICRLVPTYIIASKTGVKSWETCISGLWLLCLGGQQPSFMVPHTCTFHLQAPTYCQCWTTKQPGCKFSILSQNSASVWLNSLRAPVTSRSGVQRSEGIGGSFPPARCLLSAILVSPGGR